MNRDYISNFGDPDNYSPGTSMVMADRQIQNRLKNRSIVLEEVGNTKAVVLLISNRKWFMIQGGWGNDAVRTCMLGAVCGDVAGSVYERHNVKRKISASALITDRSRFTDDSVMTIAVAKGLSAGLARLPKYWYGTPDAEGVLYESVQSALQEYGRKYPRAGYGGGFKRWIYSDDPKPYNSWGNGSAMRASYAGWVANGLEEAELLGEISAKVTHNHPEGMKGAKVVAGCIYLLRQGKTKAEVAEYAGKFYDIDFTLDEIRDSYRFDVSCMGSVPQAIKAFLEEDSFTDVISAAISIGGDSDTIAAIAGSIAEVIYPIPQHIRGEVIDKLDDFLLNTIADSVDYIYSR